MEIYTSPENAKGVFAFNIPHMHSSEVACILDEKYGICVRGGYHWEDASKGNRKYFSVGAGFSMSVFSLDAAYLISTAQSNPLDQTLRFSLAFDMDGLKDLIGRRRR